MEWWRSLIQTSVDSSFTLTPEALRRQDDSPDSAFYREPRFVYHIDEGAVAAVTQLYREHFPETGAILDLASSWVSHLPDEAHYRRVVGLGLNRLELERNPRLTERLVQDLNLVPALPFPDHEFDGVGLCVSIDYLIQPVAVVREIGRVLKPGAPLAITFSNRAFWSKTVAIWSQLSEQGRGGLILHYLQQAGNFTKTGLLDRSPVQGDPLHAVIGFAG